MPKYANGRVPLSALVQIRNPEGDLNPRHWLPAATAAKHYELVRRAREKYGKWLRITPGWNGYRPYEEQVIGRRNACAKGNCLAAASPGFSSHGLTWVHKVHTGNRWVDAAAIDYGNWWEVFPSLDAWAAAVESVGLRFGLIRKDVAGTDEWWHVIDLDPWGPVTAFAGARPLPEQEEESEEDEMKLKGLEYTRKSDGKSVFMLFNEASGFYAEHEGVDGSYNTALAQAWGTGDWPETTESHANVIKNALNNVRLGR